MQTIDARRVETVGFDLGKRWFHVHGDDDVVAERERLAGAVAGRTDLPLVGLTRGTDGAWSGRLWLREEPHTYARRWVRSVRVVGRQLGITYGPFPLLRLPETQSTFGLFAVFRGPGPRHPVFEDRPERAQSSGSKPVRTGWSDGRRGARSGKRSHAAPLATRPCAVRSMKPCWIR